jgi:hypothetical protein
MFDSRFSPNFIGSKIAAILRIKVRVNDPIIHVHPKAVIDRLWMSAIKSLYTGLAWAMITMPI